MSKKITVRVTELGYIFLKRQKPGTVLTIDEKDFAPRWMEKVSAKRVVDEKYVVDEPVVAEEAASDSSSEEVI